MDVVRFSSVLSGFGLSGPFEDVASVPYMFTKPCRDLQ